MKRRFILAHINFKETARLSLARLESLKRAEYDDFNSIFCPLLGEEVVFRADGFEHTLRDGKGKYRNESEQRERLNLLSYVPEAITNATKFGAEPRLKQISRHGVTSQETYYRLYYQIEIAGERYEIAVILFRNGENGLLRFRSVFKANKSRRSKKAD